MSFFLGWLSKAQSPEEILIESWNLFDKSYIDLLVKNSDEIPDIIKTAEFRNPLTKFCNFSQIY